MPLRMLSDSPTKVSPCPYCDAPLDCVSKITDDPSDNTTTASPGAWSVCIKCAQPLVFTDDMSLRRPFPGEEQEVRKAHPDVMKIIDFTAATVRSMPRNGKLDGPPTGGKLNRAQRRSQDKSRK